MLYFIIQVVEQIICIIYITHIYYIFLNFCMLKLIIMLKGGGDYGNSINEN